MTNEEMSRLLGDLVPIAEAAIARGEDLSTQEHMQRFLERLLEQSGYRLRGDAWVESVN
jgi:hypothetical protein